MSGAALLGVQENVGLSRGVPCTSSGACRPSPSPRRRLCASTVELVAFLPSARLTPKVSTHTIFNGDIDARDGRSPRVPFDAVASSHWPSCRLSPTMHEYPRSWILMRQEESAHCRCRQDLAQAARCCLITLHLLLSASLSPRRAPPDARHAGLSFAVRWPAPHDAGRWPRACPAPVGQESRRAC